MFYPEATPERCTAALLLEVDPIGLVRAPARHRGGDAVALAQYVNDRPYAASSLLAAAMTKVFRTAMTGRCDARPELAATPLPLEIARPGPAVPRAAPSSPRGSSRRWAGRSSRRRCRWIRRMPEWGDSRYLSVRLTGDASGWPTPCNHLYVLLPVLDDAKHYWVSPDEVDKLIRAGGGWLAGHPEKELITRRYLRHRGSR